MGLFAKLFAGKDRKAKAEKLKIGMEKTRKGSLSSLRQVLLSANRIDEGLYDKLEEIFVTADIGVDTAVRFLGELRKEVKRQNLEKPMDLQNLIVDKLFDLYLQGQIVDTRIPLSPNGLSVLLFVGVNGTGKTTSIAKIAHFLQNEGKKVMLAAGDTFRAGAIEQLRIWGDRLGCPVIAKTEGADPSSVIFEAIREAKKTQVDVLLCDTAGRLQNKVNLMKELEKIHRTIVRETGFPPQATYLVIDATTGQNGLSQAKVFSEVTPITGIVLTKLDGTAKGGIVLAIRNELGIPISFVGLGEKITDLTPFDIEDYIYGLFADFFDSEGSR
jgi:fused signal recognition particle receptor